ncbi:hypothetical protein Tco_0961854, partial [Tanacetum coccineum]
LAVPTFQQGEDLIDCINKAMAFLSAVASRFPSSNNQLKTSSNPRNQATIQDGRVTVQQVQGRQTQSFAGTRNRGIAPKRPRSSTWFKEKLILVESQEAGQTEDLDAYDSDCDDISSAKAVLMANLSSCDLDAHSKALSNHVKEKESLSPTLTGFKTESKEKESKYIYKEIVLEKQNKELENILFLKDTFNAFDKIVLDEITEVQTVFNQIEAAVDQCSVDKNAFEIQSNLQLICNDEILKQIMAKDNCAYCYKFVAILMLNKSCVDECNKCLKLKTELLKKKAQSQEKDTVIRKLKDKIKSLSRKDSVENVKKDIDEIETINIELEHNLNAQLQEFFFAIAALKNELRKLKGKNIVETAVSKPRATTAPGMFKLDIEPISHRLKNNRDAHEVYLEKNIENTDTLRGLVECARKQNPSEPLLESACMFTKHVQELLVYVSKTCPSLMKPTKKLVVVTPMNKDKKVRFAEPVTSLSNIPKQTDSLRTKDSNKPLLTSTGVNTTTSASGSKPIGRTFTIVGNKCPLTRFTSTKVVPTKETTNKSVLTPTQGIIVYSRRPKAPKLVGSSSKSKITESRISNSSDPTQSGGSTVSDVPSSSLNDCRFGNDHIAKIMGYGDYQMGNVTISRVYYVEGLGHNLFSDRKPDLSYFHVFGALYYPTNDSKDLVMAYEQYSSRPGPKLMSPRTIRSGLVQNIPSPTPYVPPTKNDWEISFQPMFDEYLNPPPCFDSQVPAVIAPEPAVSTGTPSSTTIDQDAPSTSTSQTTQETPSPVIPLRVEDAD